MIKNIVRDAMFLSMPSQKATPADAGVIRDLKDTLMANQDRCVGMAANMIGVQKCILICAIGPGQLILVNPEIVSREGAYETKEGCLCHEGERPVKRYQHSGEIFRRAVSAPGADVFGLSGADYSA